MSVGRCISLQHCHRRSADKEKTSRQHLPHRRVHLESAAMAAELNFKQELTACFGYPVAENPTQAMIEPAYRDMGLDWRYLTLEVKPEDLPAAVAGAKAFGFQGFNCTIPHKVEVIQHLDELGESAALMGAVNCVVNRDGQLI